MDNSLRFVYLLQSTRDPEQYYVGLTSDPRNRLAARNDGDSPDTARHRPWRLVVMIEFADEHRALAFERYLKSGSGREFSRRHFH
jgi:putative endonuclease